MIKTDSLKESIGIIGGAGPEAGALFFQEIVECLQKQYECQYDYEFPEIVLYSFPFSDMLSSKAQENFEILSGELEYTIKKLENWGFDNIAIACNTLHCFLSTSNPTNSSSFFHLPIETEKCFLESNQKEALILCSNTTKKLNLYDFPNFHYPEENEQKKINKIIIDTLSGKNLNSLADDFASFIKNRCKKHTTAIIACTELSVLRRKIPETFEAINYLDPMEIVAKKICKKCFNKQEGL